MLLQLLVFSTAFASRVSLHSDDNVPTSTPYGEMPTRMARAVCGSQFAFVGTIVTVTSRYQGNVLVSDLVFELERRLYGDVPPAPVLTTMGGSVNGIFSRGSNDLPTPTEGLRYLLSYSLLKRSVGRSQEGDPVITATFWISPPDELPTSALPSESELMTQLDQFCADNALPRYHNIVGG
ncbi:MAG: hypothetical protein R3F59_11815 [Myxococcota bacterium]